MSDAELLVLARNLRNVYWPEEVPVESRLEIVKARLTIDRYEAERSAKSDGSTFSPTWWIAASSGAGAMLRCVPGYYPQAVAGVPDFTEAWAYETLRKHAGILKRMNEQ